jgi:UDP-glucose 4-epimerase
VRAIVTGGAGFIGSNLVDLLLDQGHDVLALDNFSTGSRQFLELAHKRERFRLAEMDLLHDASGLPGLVDGADVIYHLAANADVRFGWDSPRRDLDQNVIVTVALLEAARETGVRRFVFSSTGSVYGEAATFPTPERAAFPIQTSLYGASKTAAEGFIEAYAEGAGIVATIFRFVSVLGRRYTHGHVLDFVRALDKDPSHLRILGDGSQRKSYMDVSDCVRAVAGVINQETAIEIYNLGVDSYFTVTESAGWICNRLGVQPEFLYTGGSRGWIGDNPFIFLDAARIRATGWEPHYSIRDAIERTVDYLVANSWVLDEYGSDR